MWQIIPIVADIIQYIPFNDQRHSIEKYSTDVFIQSNVLIPRISTYYVIGRP